MFVGQIRGAQPGCAGTYGREVSIDAAAPQLRLPAAALSRLLQETELQFRGKCDDSRC